MKKLSRLEKSASCWFLITTIIVFFFLKLPSLFEPLWYGDEAIYQVLGNGIADGRLLYKEIWDNKPPLLYILYFLTKSDLFGIRLLSLIFGIGCVLAFFVLAKRLLTNKKSVFVATAVFSFLFAIPLFEGNIANAENFMALPILLSGVYLTSEKKGKNNLLIAGVLLGIAFLFKIVAVFDTAAFFLFLFFTTIKTINLKSVVSAIMKHIYFAVGFLLPVGITFLYFLMSGAFLQFYTATFTQMVGYVGYGNRFIVAHGLLFAKLFLLSFSVLLLFIWRKRMKSTTLFVLLWLPFSIFNAFFAQRPYTHYLLVLLPATVLFGALLYESLKLNAKTQNSWVKRGVVAYLLLLILVLFNFRISAKSIPYYGNFISYILGSKNTSEYQTFFDRNTPRDYEIAQFIKMNIKQGDSIFIWGNNPQIYTLTNTLPLGRFTVAYHMNANNNTMKEAEDVFLKKKPRFIIVTSPNQPFPFSTIYYSPRFTIRESIIYERIY